MPTMHVFASCAVATVISDSLTHDFTVVTFSMKFYQFSFIYKDFLPNKPIGDWISAPIPNFVTMATRVGPQHFAWFH